MNGLNLLSPDTAAVSPHDSPAAAWRTLHSETLPTLKAQAHERFSGFTTFNNAAPRGDFTDADVEQASAALESAAQSCEEARRILDESASVAILAGPDALREHRAWAEEWADFAAALALYRNEIPKLQKIGAKNHRLYRLQRGLAEVVQNGKAAVEHSRDAQKVLPKVVKYLEAAQVFEDSEDRLQRELSAARDVLDETELGRIGAAIYAATREYRLKLSVPGGRHSVCRVTVLPKLSGADAEPGALFVPKRPPASLVTAAHGEAFDASRFALDIEGATESAVSPPAADDRATNLPSNILEDEHGVRWRVLSVSGDVVIQKQQLQPGDEHYREPRVKPRTTGTGFGEMGVSDGLAFTDAAHRESADA